MLSGLADRVSGAQLMLAVVSVLAASFLWDGAKEQ